MLTLRNQKIQILCEKFKSIKFKCFEISRNCVEDRGCVKFILYYIFFIAQE